MSPFENAILALLTQQPGLKVSQIAQALNVTTHDVNHALYGNLASKCQKDASHRWSLKSGSKVPDSVKKEPTELTSLCNYYLSCIGYDNEKGISVFASSNKGNPDYFQTDKLVNLDINSALSSTGGQKLVQALNKEGNRKELYLGYPCFLKHVKSGKTGWQGFFVEPLIYLPIERDAVNSLLFKLSDQAPVINYAAVKSITQMDTSLLAQEITMLEEELGYNSDEPLAFEELVYPLQAVRKAWPWKGKMNPAQLYDYQPLSVISEQGIYNAAVIVIADRSPYTVGLESELKALAEMPMDRLGDTALGNWLMESVNESKEDKYEDLLEVFQMNTEQRQAVASSFSRSLTVITGPPGTGKSQVVTNLLINCFWRNQRVLFASKNNQAVDVVEARVNSLGSRPVLMRTGSDEHKEKLSKFLMNYLAQTNTETKDTEYKTLKLKRDGILAKVKSLQAEEQILIDHRNQVDAIELRLEYLREKLSPNEFSDIGSWDLTWIYDSLCRLRNAAIMADRSRQGLFARLFWHWMKTGRLEELRQAFIKGSSCLLYGDRDFDNDNWTAARMADLHKAVEQNLACVSEMESVKEYLAKLQELQSLKAPPSISKEMMDLTAKLAEIDGKLWECYLQLLPSKLSKGQKQKLSDLQVSQQLLSLSATNLADAKAVDKLRFKHNDLLLDLSSIFPCWAVTSLSVKNRIPFEAGYFDLVVIDEASQCDIASALPLLFRAKRAVIIGDVKQLRHISNLPAKQDLRMMSLMDETLSRLAWMYSQNSLFDLALRINASEAIELKDHHRSHNDIIEFSNRFFYRSSLRVATKIANLQTLSLKDQGIRWVDVKGVVVRPSEGGAYNLKEADAVVAEIRKLALESRYLGSIGVVTPFRAQANLIRKKLTDMADMQSHILANQILVDVVHKYQGDEKDLMIFSPVYSVNMPDGGRRFLVDNPNLFNVAITRARALLIVVGDRQECLKCDIEYLRAFALYCTEKDYRQQTQIQLTVAELNENYPPVSDLSLVSDWEKHLYKVMFTNGIKAIPQYAVDRYILDFALFHKKRMLDIEVDGEHYHRGWDGEISRRDQIRNQRMFELGWDVMRFWVYELRDDMPGVILRIKTWLAGSEIDNDSN